MVVKHDVKAQREGTKQDAAAPRDKKAAPWKKPTLEDVSGKVMAQPYIRFT